MLYVYHTVIHGIADALSTARCINAKRHQIMMVLKNLLLKIFQEALACTMHKRQFSLILLHCIELMCSGTQNHEKESKRSHNINVELSLFPPDIRLIANINIE